MDTLLFFLLGLMFLVFWGCIHCLYRKKIIHQLNHMRELTRPTRVVPVVRGVEVVDAVEVVDVPPRSVSVDVTI